MIVSWRHQAITWTNVDLISTKYFGIHSRILFTWKPLPSCVQIFTFKSQPQWVNTLRPRQNGRHFADDTFKRIFLNENVRISIKISLKFVPNGPIDNNLALVQIMAWCRSGDKPLSEPMMVSLLTHICVTRPQCVNWFCDELFLMVVFYSIDSRIALFPAQHTILTKMSQVN